MYYGYLLCLFSQNVKSSDVLMNATKAVHSRVSCSNGHDNSN